MTLAGEAGDSKGVDSTCLTDSAVAGARALAHKYGCVTCASGVEDVVMDGANAYRVYGGNGLMPFVTGLGCTCTAICAAFACVNSDFTEATVHGMAAMSMAGIMAADKADGPGTLQLHLYDALYSMGESDLERLFKVEFF